MAPPWPHLTPAVPPDHGPGLCSHQVEPSDTAGSAGSSVLLDEGRSSEVQTCGQSLGLLIGPKVTEAKIIKHFVFLYKPPTENKTICRKKKFCTWDETI